MNSCQKLSSPMSDFEYEYRVTVLVDEAVPTAEDHGALCTSIARLYHHFPSRSEARLGWSGPHLVQGRGAAALCPGPAPLRSRQRAPRCRPPPERLAAPLTFVTAFGLRRPPHAQPGLCASRVPPTHPRLSRGRACASRIARTCIARLRPSAAQPDAANFCNGYGLRHPLYPTRPLRLTSAAIAPASTF